MKKLTQHYFSGQTDFLAMRRMLIDGYLAENRPCNMFFYYLDNWRYAIDESEEYFKENAIIWTADQETIAFSILDDEPLYRLQIHPSYYDATPQILDFLGGKGLLSQIAVYEHQERLIHHLVSSGFGSPNHIQNEYEYDISSGFKAKTLPDQNVICTATDVQDILPIYRAKGLVFPGPNTSVEACAFRMNSKQQSQSYSNDGVHLVYDKGMTECVSFAMAWYDTETLVVGFEPVGTVPNHRKRGVSGALLSHAFSKAYESGYRRVSIKTSSDGDSAANHLYHSLGPIKIHEILEFSPQ